MLLIKTTDNKFTFIPRMLDDALSSALKEDAIKVNRKDIRWIPKRIHMTPHSRPSMERGALSPYLRPYNNFQHGYVILNAKFANNLG